MGGIDQLLRLKGVTFEWNEPEKHAGQTGTQRGFIAQDVEKVFPTWVAEDPKGFKALSVQQIEALEVESIRSLKTENDELRSRTARLEDRLNALESSRPLAGIGFGKGSLGFIGLGVVGGAFMISRRKRQQERS